MKPDYRLYFRRQFSKYPYIVKSETGDIFREINGENHKLAFRFIRAGLILIICTICYLSLEAISKMNVYLFALVYFSISISLLIIARLVYTSILYKVSRFEIIDERELDKYPGIIQSLQRTEAGKKRKIIDGITGGRGSPPPTLSMEFLHITRFVNFSLGLPVFLYI